MGIQHEPLNLEERLRNFYLLLGNSNQPWNGPLDVLLCTPSPKSFSRSQLLPCLAGVQLDPRATCALRWPESPSDSLNICENEPDQRRNSLVPLGRERIGRPKKGVTVLVHILHAISDRAICTGKPSPELEPLPSLGRTR